jgi:FkbM family methyltransferase
MNVLLNDVEDRVKTLPVAASNEVGESELVVTPTRGGKHWIATDRSKLGEKHAIESTILAVETVTLDRLVETGVIEPENTGLLWMDAEGHEGHILEGASSLLARGTPLVLEWNPRILDRMGDRGKLERAVAENYTHFAGLRRHPEVDQPGYPLQTADRLPAYAERFLDPSYAATKTDILVLRLEQDQAAGIRSLDALISRRSAYGVRGLLARLRSRLSRRRSRA